ncbi:hypothetical protein IQ241_14000 [Romeria aff. gracilis LEGE 07310]|uniref:Adenosine deaminase n=1 Tax=Vasconcelosia minhoensis LEGE 07310 TaxID=915328 RepID=A0A8J7DRF3_9CYAN|nr:hypothetical protein [Romeria gracilis]MBE9078394.1 hypothetical protein [Romeria aff. gracilis LEGE 07310]
MAEHNLKQLMDRGLCITVNSDDPAYFGGCRREFSGGADGARAEPAGYLPAG